ncbi:hypothetical protein [Providencia stuartii]|uniref:hypothetical protein n=1 Tax=Providencia stuartii TaxID=588 RepID=UPI0024ABD4BE|nr:hypothetical protein [Providencia stuartii]MCR4081127.1 hypothetical protein [Providencia stuartii]
MKRILAVAAVIALLVGCDSKQDAPFGLKWGQSMDSVGFIKDGDCEKESEVTICKFDNRKPFNEWTYSNELKFNKEGLVEIETVSVGEEEHNPSFQNFKEKLDKEFEFLLIKGFDKEILNQVKQKCESSIQCDKTSERSNASIGVASIWITTSSTQTPIEVTTYTK